MTYICSGYSILSQQYKTNGKKMIFIGIMDLDASYLRIHANATTGSTCIAILDKLAFLCLWLPFYTTPAPAEYMTVRKAAIDLGNNLLRDKSCYTENLISPHRSSL